jgi:hypothetical protein
MLLAMENKILIIDEFLNELDAKLLSKEIIQIPWHYVSAKTAPVLEEAYDKINKNNYFQFVHIVFDSIFPNPVNSSLFDKLQSIYSSNYFKDYQIERIKVNLQTNTNKILKTPLHIDSPNAKLTAIYYVNTNNGYTEFTDGSIVKSKRNRLVIFDSKKLHFGTTCTDKSIRVVINFNFL